MSFSASGFASVSIFLNREFMCAPYSIESSGTKESSGVMRRLSVSASLFLMNPEALTSPFFISALSPVIDEKPIFAYLRSGVTSTFVMLMKFSETLGSFISRRIEASSLDISSFMRPRL